MGEIVSSSVAL